MTYGPYNEEEIRWHIQRAAMDLVEPLINNWSDRSQKNDAEMTGSAGMIANVVCNHVLLMQRAGSDPQATLREALLPLIDDPEILNLVTKLLKKNWFVIVDASEKHTLQYFPQIPASEAARTSNVAISSPARNEGRETIVAGEKKSVLGGRNLEEAAILPSTTAPIAISASRHAKRSLRPHAIEKYREREHSSPALFPYTVLKSNWEMLPKEYAASCTCTVSVSHQWMVPRTCVTVEHIPCDVTDINELIPFFMDYATVCAIQCDEMRMCAMVRFLNFPAVEALLDTPYFLFGKPQVTISPCTPLEVCSLYNPSESTFTEHGVSQLKGIHAEFNSKKTRLEKTLTDSEQLVKIIQASTDLEESSLPKLEKAKELFLEAKKNFCEILQSLCEVRRRLSAVKSVSSNR